MKHLHLIIIICLLCCLFPFGAIAYGSDETVFYGDDYTLSYKIASKWDSGYNAVVDVKNTSDVTIPNWCFRIPLSDKITNVWNATILDELSDDYYVYFKNKGYNQDIKPGETVQFGFTCSGSFSSLPSFVEKAENMRMTVPPDKIGFSYEIINEWDENIIVSLETENYRDTPIEDWIISFDYEGDIEDIWDAEIISHEGDHYEIKNPGYHQNIDAYDDVTFTIVVRKNGKKIAEIRNVKVSGYGLHIRHDLEEEETIEPTCLEPGYTRYVCSFCGEEVMDDFVDALGHDYEVKTIDPTYDEEGYDLHTCINCGDTYKDNYIPKNVQVSYKVVLPVSVSLNRVRSNYYEAEYEVQVTGNLSPGQYVNVVPEISEFRLTDDRGKRIIKPVFDTDKVSWSYEDLKDDEGLPGKTYISAYIPKAGVYKGDLIYDFSLSNEPAELP